MGNRKRKMVLGFSELADSKMTRSLVSFDHNETGMSDSSAIGYMIEATKELRYTPEEIDRIKFAMKQKIESLSNDEAKQIYERFNSGLHF